MLTAFSWLLTVAYWPGIISASIAPRWAVLMVGLPILLIVYWRLHLAFLASWAVMGAYMVLTTLWAPNVPVAVGDLVHWAILLMAVLLGSILKDEHFDQILYGLSVGLALSVLMCIVQLADQPFHNWIYFNDWSANAPGGLFTNRNVVAETAAPVFMWAMLRKKWWATIFPVLLLIITHTRAAPVAIVAVATLYVVGLRWLIWMWISLVVVDVVVIAHQFILTDSVYERLEIWATVAPKLNLFGHGAGSFAFDYPYFQAAHNDILQFGYQYGIAAVAVAVVWLAWLCLNVKDWARYVVLVIFVESLVSFPLEMPTTGFIAAVLAGRLFGLRDRLQWLEYYRGNPHSRRIRQPKALPGGSKGGSQQRCRDLSI